MGSSRNFWALLFAIALGATNSSISLAQSGVDHLQRASSALASGKPDEALTQARAASASIATSLPFAIQRAVLVESPTQGFGMEIERASNRYGPGDTIEIYVEPQGYGYNEQDGRYNFGFSVDLVVTDPNGTILGGANEFGSWLYDSRQPNLETYLQLAISLNQIPPGNYILDLRLHDLTIQDVSASTQIEIEVEG